MVCRVIKTILLGLKMKKTNDVDIGKAAFGSAVSRSYGP